MFKRIFSTAFVAFVLATLGGCYVVPMQPSSNSPMNNVIGGAVAGGLLGAAIGDTRKAAGIGAGLGALLGASVSQPYNGYGTPVHGAPAPNCPRADGLTIFARNAHECRNFREALNRNNHYSGGQVPPGHVSAGTCPSRRFPAGCRLVNGQWMGVPAY